MEIERKFLTKEIPFALSAYPMHTIEQCYISTSPTIRIRAYDDTYILTVKGRGDIARAEFELAITRQEYIHLLQKAETPMVCKKRYVVPIGDGLKAEIDIYEGKLSGLITTEVEFASVAQAERFVPPDWFGKDVSQDHRYKNTSLSKHGIPSEQADI